METLTIDRKEASIKTPEKYLENKFDLTEIINGVEIVAPSPFSKHQKIVRNLYDIVRQYTKKHKMGEALFSPLDVIFEEKVNKCQPDIIFIKKENLHIVQDFIRGVPNMVCEIISKGSHTKDTVTKRDIYERYGVPEYWIVFPEYETIEVFTIEDGKYQLFSIAEGEGSVNSKVIEGLTVDVKDVFED